MKKFLSSFFITGILALGVMQSGCALFLVGAGAAGGYAIIGKDEIEGMADASSDKVYRAAREVIKSQGAITFENAATGEINAAVNNSQVEIHIEQVTPKTVRTRIKARKTSGLFPDIDLAQNIYGQLLRKIR